MATLSSATLLACQTDEGGDPGEELRAAPDFDVVIIGGGLSGLTAARSLAQAGYSVRVLEARPHVGGRTTDWNLNPGIVAEAGAQWVGVTQTAILQLAEELGVETFPADVEGNTRLHFEGTTFDTPASAPSAEVLALHAELDALAQSIPVEAPWSAPDAAALDSQTAEAWLMGQNPSADAASELRLSISIWLGDPSELSLLHLAFYIASAGSVEALEVGAQSHRFVGGPQQLSTLMAEALGDDVQTDAAVLSIEEQDDRIEVVTDTGSITARRVVVAMAPSDADRIAFDPPLTDLRQQLQSAWVSNPGIKQHAVYSSPFWREEGLSGTAITDLATALTFDASPPSGEVGILVVFPNDDALPPTEDARRTLLLEELTVVFGPEAATPIETYEQDWSNESWIAGCVSPLPPGLLTQAGAALREPVGRIHWAGTETATVWTGYMDGAVRSGQRAALEVGDALVQDEA